MESLDGFDNWLTSSRLEDAPVCNCRHEFESHNEKWDEQKDVVHEAACGECDCLEYRPRFLPGAW